MASSKANISLSFFDVAIFLTLCSHALVVAPIALEGDSCR